LNLLGKCFSILPSIPNQQAATQIRKPLDQF
jgi:hypothetical protein